MPDISIVIPAFNEAKRLPLFLERVIGFCKESSLQYEIIVVDDGSRDNTGEVARAFAAQFSDLRTIRFGHNTGKGHAVRAGLMAATGDIALFLDADGSTGPEEIERNLHYLTDGGFDIFAGSRVLSDEQQVMDARWYRRAMGAVFNLSVQTLLFSNVRDTQCGFKMFRKEVIFPLFSRNRLQGFGFDIEILYLAHKLGYRVKEGPVSWHHVRGSKINLPLDSMRMFVNILQVKHWYRGFSDNDSKQH